MNTTESEDKPMTVKCGSCGLTWNVSIHTKIPESGYECPYCTNKKEQRKRKEKQRRRERREMVKGAACFLAFLGIAGSVGALEVGSIGMLQSTIQALICLSVTAILMPRRLWYRGDQK